MTPDEVKIILRPFGSKLDEAFVYSSWLNSYYKLKPRPLPKKDWFNKKSKEIKDLLEVSDIKIACFKDSPYVILGYAVIRNKKIEWSYVKADYRDQGIEQLFNNQVEKYGRNTNPANQKNANSGTEIPSLI